MQGERSSALSSLPEILDFDHGPSSGDPSMLYMDSIPRNGPNLIGRSLGESSSSNTHNQAYHNEAKMELGDPANSISLDNVEISLSSSNQHLNGAFLMQGSSSEPIHQNLNLNAGFIGHHRSGSRNEWVPSASNSSNLVGASSESGGYLVEENRRRLSCKRKAYEGNVGPSSSLSISAPSSESDIHGPSPSEQVRPRLRLGSGSERTRRNFRLRINPSHQQDSDSLNPNIVSTGNNNVNISTPPHPSARLIPVNESLDLRSDNPSPPNQIPPVVIHGPSLPPNIQPFGWNEGSSSRPAASSNSERNNMINLGRNIANWGLMSRTTSSDVDASAAPTWAPSPHYTNPLPSRYPRRLSEFVRRSLSSSSSSSSGSELGGRGVNYPLLRGSTSVSSREMIMNHQLYPRWMERQGDGALGAPRTVATNSEGRSRLVSEIRSVLDLMRRGEGLRFEDVMILDQTVFFGAADIHDRHRDMRLDVDNMSYEELLALEERIGNVSTGLSEETISKNLKNRKCIVVASDSQSDVEPCCICQEEYNDGEDLGTLECGHDFHTACIKQWLMYKNLCPICKTNALVT